MSQISRGEFTHETRARLFRIERIREVLAREPELDPWQVEERFGIRQHEAQAFCSSARAKLRADSEPGAVKPGQRFGRLVVVAVGVKPAVRERREGKGWSDGAWCRVRCDCGEEKLVRARHLRRGHVASCAKRGCVKIKQFPCAVCGRPICKRWMQRHVDARHGFPCGEQGLANLRRMAG